MWAAMSSENVLVWLAQAECLRVEALGRAVTKTCVGSVKPWGSKMASQFRSPRMSAMGVHFRVASEGERMASWAEWSSAGLGKAAAEERRRVEESGEISRRVKVLVAASRSSNCWETPFWVTQRAAFWRQEPLSRVAWAESEAVTSPSWTRSLRTARTPTRLEQGGAVTKASGAGGEGSAALSTVHDKAQRVHKMQNILRNLYTDCRVNHSTPLVLGA